MGAPEYPARPKPVSLPISNTYLELALRDGLQIKETRLVHRHIADLVLLSGELVACDPFVSPETGAFKISLPRGNFPVILSVAHVRADQRVAFATIRFNQTMPTRWQMLTVGNQQLDTLKDGDYFGYGVDSGTGCFMDRSTGKALY